MGITNKLQEKLGKTMLWLCAAATLVILFIIIAYVVKQGFSSLSWEFLTEMPRRRGRLGGIYPTIVSTVYLMLLSAAIATPVALGAAVYMTEYTRDNLLIRVVRFGTESLAGIPSIIFGLFGYVFFVLYLNLGWSIISGSLTLAIMILPILIRTTEESIKTVPVAYREGSLALGATKWQTIRKVVLPSAVPGVITGVILGMGRAVGETAAVMLTAGSALRLPENLLDNSRAMSVHLYLLSMEGTAIDKAFGTALVLIIFILIINLSTNVLLSRFAKNVG
ncbi:MAG: phosphate ABC transporter permease PstA [Carboxydocellales bacterium]